MYHILKQLNRQQLEQIVEDLSDEIRFLENHSQNLQEMLDIVAENERNLPRFCLGDSPYVYS